MDIYELSSENILREGYKMLANGKRCMAFCAVSSGFVCISKNGVVDEQLCYDLGYKVYEMMHNGGTIVADAGDIDIANFGENKNTFRNDFCNYLVSWLVERGLNAEFVKNDILVDGYKVCGTGIRTYGKTDYTTIHVGINTNLENIKKICKKPMVKIPKGLGDYGIATNEIRELFNQFCEEYYGEANWISKLN